MCLLLLPLLQITLDNYFRKIPKLPFSSLFCLQKQFLFVKLVYLLKSICFQTHLLYFVIYLKYICIDAYISELKGDILESMHVYYVSYDSPFSVKGH